MILDNNMVVDKSISMKKCNLENKHQYNNPILSNIKENDKKYADTEPNLEDVFVYLAKREK